MSKVLILGGYGNFGKRISAALAKGNLPIIISGWDKKKAEILANELRERFPNSQVETAIFDANKELSRYLSELEPAVVINTCGPFQTADYSIAEPASIIRCITLTLLMAGILFAI